MSFDVKGGDHAPVAVVIDDPGLPVGILGVPVSEIEAQPEKPSYRPRKPRRELPASRVYGRRQSGVDPKTGERQWEATSVW